MDASNIQPRGSVTLEDFILWAKSSDVGIQQIWKASLQDVVNLLNTSIGSGTVIHPKGPLAEKKVVVGSGGSALETTDITIKDIEDILKQRLTSVGGGVKFYDGIKDNVHSFRTIDGDTDKNILVTLDGSGNRIVISLNKDLLQNLKLPYNAIPLGNEKGELRYLEKGDNFSILQTLNGAVQWAPLKVGEVNTVENLGKGLPLFHSKAAERLRFKTLSTNSPEIKITEKGGEIFLDYKAQHKLVSVSDEIKVTPKDGELQLSFHTNPIKGYAELEVSTKPVSVPENKAHYTFLINTNELQDINPLVYTEYEGINDGAIVTFVNAGKKDMKFGPYTFVPHAYISMRWDAEGHSFNKI